MQFGETYTITIGDCAENHVGMQKLGLLANSGFDLKDINAVKDYFINLDPTLTIEIVNLNDYNSLVPTSGLTDPYVLIIRKGLDALLGTVKKTAADFYNEQQILDKDKKAFMYGRVVNKKARHNLCFSDTAQVADFSTGQGTVVAFRDVPLLKYVMDSLPTILGDKGKNMVAEGNYYYDIHQTGIGWHGDTERVKVIGLRVGESLPLHFQWFQNSKPIGNTAKFVLNHGDIYLMSEKATGNDWKKKKIATLRHAAGAAKYLQL